MEIKRVYIKAVYCQYCDSRPMLKQGYYGFYFLCVNCGARVGCHRETKEPLGSLANKKLRVLRMQLHSVFDCIWKDAVSAGCERYGARKRAYDWLANELKLPKEYSHIGYFDECLCHKAIEICKRFTEANYERC